jgi:hypothetical protein
MEKKAETQEKPLASDETCVTCRFYRGKGVKKKGRCKACKKDENGKRTNWTRMW